MTRVCLAFALSCLLALPAAAQDRVQLNEISKIEVKGASVEITGSRRPSFTTFTLTEPARLVIDISEAVLAGAPRELKVGNGTITSIKTISYGGDSAAIARVLIGFERELETDIVTAGNQLIVKLPADPRESQRLAAEQQERERANHLAAETAEKERVEKERAARLAAEAAEKDRLEKERAEKDRLAAEEAERAAQARVEREAKLKAEREEKARLAREEAEHAAQEKAEREAKLKTEREEKARLAREEAERTAQERAEREAKRKAEQEAQERVAAQAKAEREAKLQAEREEKARLAREEAADRARAKAEREARVLAEREEKARAAREARDREALEAQAKAEQEKAAREEATRRQREEREQHARELAEREAKIRAERELAHREADSRGAREGRELADAQAQHGQDQANERQTLKSDEKARKQRELEAAALATPSPSELALRPTRVTFIGFKQDHGIGRVSVRTSSPPKYAVGEDAARNVVVTFENARIGLPNNQRLLDTSFFDTAVSLVKPEELDETRVRISVTLKRPVQYRTRQEGNELTLEFQRPE
jgi:hypothetical protein